MPIPCHIIVEGNPAIIYACRNGGPDRILPILQPFVEQFTQERETLGEYLYTPECLVAQITVRFGFEFCEDDFSNLRISINYDPTVEYLYYIDAQQTISVWVPEAAYRTNPQLGLQGCRRLETSLVS